MEATITWEHMLMAMQNLKKGRSCLDIEQVVVEMLLPLLRADGEPGSCASRIPNLLHGALDDELDSDVLHVAFDGAVKRTGESGCGFVIMGFVGEVFGYTIVLLEHHV